MNAFAICEPCQPLRVLSSSFLVPRSFRNYPFGLDVPLNPAGRYYWFTLEKSFSSTHTLTLRCFWFLHRDFRR